MKNKWLQQILIILVSMLPAAYILVIWLSIPDIVPTHFNSAMEPNGYSSKSGLLAISSVLAAVSVLLYFLMEYIHKIDPKRALQDKAPIFNVLGTGLALFFTAINFVAILMSINKGSVPKHSLDGLIGLLFVFLGVAMPKIKPNYFVGVRLPWTLSSDYNWRKTHELTGKLWLAGGILFTVLSLLLPVTATHFLVPVFIPILAGVPIVYSFILFKKEQANPDIAKQEPV